MAEEEKNGLSDAVQKGASAAHTIRGAVKTGKAISGAAKGAANGGVYGAAAGFLWENRKTVGKVIIASLVVLILPLLFILMLPSLIFGGLTEAFSPSNPEVPILNDGAAIVENANSISFAINGALGEGLTDVTARIESDFASSGGDQIEVANPYEGNLVYNANRFVAQYCAAKDQDFASISIADMESTLRGAKSHLYSYTRTSEERETTVTTTTTDPDTGAVVETEETVTELWMIYTVVYNGEAYFEDTVFALTDKQKELADDYAQNLSLFLGDGMIQGLLPSEFSATISLGDIRFTDGQTPVVYFNQLDERYANEPYGTDNIGGYACGPTAMSIVVSSLTDDTVDPVEMAEWSYDNGYWCSKSGSYHALIPAAAEAWGLPVEGCSASEGQRIVDALSNGKLVVAIMSKGHFTSGGHFIVLRGVKDDKILVADPASYTRSEKEWDLSIICSEASKYAGAGGPFWIIG
ncbi:MAG: C39 family peptidase [Oscillospiraceae bacterium]|nr:C39 family peptidase [Oscillospiraceae bacterium]